MRKKIPTQSGRREKKKKKETMSQWQKRQVSKFLFFILIHSKVEIFIYVTFSVPGKMLFCQSWSITHINMLRTFLQGELAFRELKTALPYMDRCSVSLIIREMQIKTTMRTSLVVQGLRICLPMQGTLV